MAVVLSPLTLRFSNSNLEKEYETYRTNITLLATDWRFSMVNVCAYVPFLMMDVVLKRDVFTKAMALKCAGLGLVLLQWLMQTQKEFWIQHRWNLISFIRTLRLFVFLIGVSSWIDQPSVDVQTLFKTAVLQSGMLVNAWYSLGMPLMFFQHLVLQAIQVALTVYVTATPTCTKIFQTEDSRQLFAKVTDSVDSVLYVLAGMQRGTETGEQDQLFELCPRLLVLGHCVIAFLLPSLVLWKMEIASRQYFVQELKRHEQWAHIQVDASWIPDIGRLLGKILHILFPELTVF